VRRVTPVAAVAPIAVGLVGLGRTAYQNHLVAFRALPELFRLVAVADPDPERCTEAQRESGCRCYGAIDDLVADDAVELVVIATPTHLHRRHTVLALEAGKAVVCDKPMATSLAEASEMLAAAARTGGLLTVFQNRRFECGFVRAREVLASGVLGTPLMIKLTTHRFLRRRDWQAVRRLGGGVLRNEAVHLIDLAAVLIGSRCEATQLLAQLTCAITPGDAEDHLKLVWRTPGDGPVVDIEVSDVSAFPEEPLVVQGTHGTLVGGPGELRWRFVRDHDLAPLEVFEGAAEGRVYGFHRIEPHEEHWLAPPDAPRAAVPYYESLHATIRHGAPLAVPAELALAVMEVVEQASMSGSAA
jgi:scyllo-inositol 2-dehydrogenase (NADP+)